MPKQQRPAGAIVIILLIFFTMAFITVQALKTTVWNIFMVILAMFLTLGTYIHFIGWDFPFLAIPKRFMALDGTIGVCISSIKDEGVGQSSIEVGIRQRYVPKFLWNNVGALRTAMMWFGGMVKVSVVADSDLFIDIPAKNCLVPQGCLLLMGSIDQDKNIIETVSYPLQSMKMLLAEKNSLAREINTRMISALSQAATNSKTTKEDLIENLYSIMPVMNQILQTREKPKTEITLGQGVG